jgi:MFS family permease
MSAWPPARRAWYIVGILCACAIVSFIDRQIINLLVDDLRADLGLSDTRISLLQGLAFALFYATCAIPLGRLADVGNRKKIIGTGLVVWTLAAAACGMAGSFTHLFLARMLVGIGEATLTPNSFSMFADLFPPDKLALPCSVFTAASFVGSGIALLGGGVLIGYLSSLPSLSLPIVGELAVWQATFIIAALPGVLVAVLLFATVREPERRGSIKAPVASVRPPLSSLVTFYLANRKVLNAIFIGISLIGAVQFSIGAWGPAYFMRVHGWTPAQVGLAYGSVLVTCGTLGAISGGWIADRIEARWGNGHLKIALVSVTITLPFVIAFPLASSGAMAVALLVPVVFFGTLSLGAGPALIPVVAEPRMRGVLVASYLFVASLIGQAGGPWLVALCTDFVFGDPQAVRYSLAIVPAILLVAAAGFLWRGLRGRSPTGDRGGQVGAPAAQGAGAQS